MASEKSLHRKIQLILENAASSSADNISELAAEIEGKKLPNFNTLQYDKKKDEFLWRQSGRVIRRAVRMCVRLGLLDDRGQLTKNGRLACRKTQFDSALAESIRGILVRDGVAMQSLNNAIAEGLKSDPPILPTAKALWEALGSEMRAGDFSRLLTLLSHCGAAESSQAKVYLRIQAR